MFKWLYRDERGVAPLAAAAGLLLLMGTVAGGATVYNVAATQADLKRAAQAVVEGEKQNGCYDAGTEQTVQNLLQNAGLDVSKVAMTATTAKQSYGSEVRARVEYVKPVQILGIDTPYQVRVAAEAADVSAHVAPVRNAPCKTPAFAQATGTSGIENGSGNQPASGPALAQNPGGEAQQPPAGGTQPGGGRAPVSAAPDPNCKRPVTLTRTVTKYRDEPYQVQIGTKQETRYRDEPYQEPVRKTRTVTKYRDETYQVQAGTRQETRYREETRYRAETYTVPVQKARTVTKYRTETYQEARTGYRTESYSVSVPHRVSYSYRVPHTRTSCSGWGRWRRCRSYTYYTTSYVNYTYYTTGRRSRSVPYTYYVTLSRRVPYQATENYTVNETRTRQVAYTARVPYTVSVPVYETRTRRVPYQATEAYTEMVAKVRKVPYTVAVPVYETRTRQVPYQATETYTDYVPCSGTGVLPVSNPGKGVSPPAGKSGEDGIYYRIDDPGFRSGSRPVVPPGKMERMPTTNPSTRYGVPGKSFRNGEVIVGWKPGTAEAQKVAVIRKIGLGSVQRPGKLGTIGVSFLTFDPAKTDIERVIDALKAEDVVRYAEPNYIAKVPVIPRKGQSPSPRFPGNGTWDAGSSQSSGTSPSWSILAPAPSPSNVSRGTGQPRTGKGITVIATPSGRQEVVPPVNKGTPGSLLDSGKRLIGRAYDAVVMAVGGLVR